MARNDAISIDAAAEADLPLILGMIRELAEFEHLAHACVATEDDLRLHLFGPRPAAEVVIARIGGQPVGFALFFPTFSTFLAKPGLYLEDVYVKPEVRRQGVGRALLQHLARLAMARDCGRLEWAALDWNEPAIRFYRKIGAVTMDEWTTFRLTGDALEQFAAGGRKEEIDPQIDAD